MIEIYEYQGSDDGYEFRARFNDNGDVDGDTIVADRLRGVLNNASFDYVEHNTAVDVVLEHRYSNAAYQTNRE